MFNLETQTFLLLLTVVVVIIVIIIVVVVVNINNIDNIESSCSEGDNEGQVSKCSELSVAS